VHVRELRPGSLSAGPFARPNLTRARAQNKQSVPDDSLPVGFAGGGSQACKGLCSVGFPSFPNAEQEAQRNSLCLFPNGEGQDGVCKKYSCQHFTKQNCASLNPMLAFMDPTASPADYFSCEELICVSCPHDAGVRGTSAVSCCCRWSLTLR